MNEKNIEKAIDYVEVAKKYVDTSFYNNKQDLSRSNQYTRLLDKALNAAGVNQYYINHLSDYQKKILRNAARGAFGSEFSTRKQNIIALSRLIHPNKWDKG